MLVQGFLGMLVLVSSQTVAPPEGLFNAPSASTAGESCGQTGADGGSHDFNVTLASATTWHLRVHDRQLQSIMPFHPLKCLEKDDDGSFMAAGRLLILGNACHVRNPDTAACFRKQNFPFPVPPSSKMLKIEMQIDMNSDGELEFVQGSGQRFQKSRADPSESTAGDITMEVCATTGSCIPNNGQCIPSFYFVYDTMLSAPLRKGVYPDQQLQSLVGLDEEEQLFMRSINNDVVDYNKAARLIRNTVKTPFFNAWEEVQSFYPTENYPLIQDIWNQPHAIAQYGPYAPCPEDSQGRALPCKGGEMLTIKYTSIKLKWAEIKGDSVSVGVKFVAEWGDRYAVHPCTVNLYNIHTSGQPLKIPHAGHWMPEFSAASETKKAVEVAEDELSVNFGFGKPVTGPVTHTEGDTNHVPWPKQLVFAREYESSFSPQLVMDWNTYPFDSQTIVLEMTDPRINKGHLILDINGTSLDHADAKVGEGWERQSASMAVVTKNDRQYLQIKVKVKRKTAGKMYSLFLPVLSVAMLDTVAHLQLDYGNSLGALFMTTAVVAGTGISMVNPTFLGIPGDLHTMPFVQCFTLMILAAALKQCALLLIRGFLLRRRDSISQAIAKASADQLVGEERCSWGVEGAAAEQLAVEGAAAERLAVEEAAAEQLFALTEREKLASVRLSRYDAFSRLSVPLWYILSWGIVALAYFS